MDEDRPVPVRDARVLGDLIARERRSGADALRAFAGDPDRSYDYRNLCTTAHKVGNFLRHLGVRGGADAATVGVAPDPVPEPLLTFLGAAGLGAVTRFDPTVDGVRVVVVPVVDADRYDPPPGTRLVVYGGPPEDPTVDRWEEGIWSENPAAPPATVGPDDAALTADRPYTHAELLAAARSVVVGGLAPGDAVVVRSPLDDPRTVAAGVVAPLLVGGVVVLPDDGRRGDVAVGEGPEPEVISLDDVPL